METEEGNMGGVFGGILFLVRATGELTLTVFRFLLFLLIGSSAWEWNIYGKDNHELHLFFGSVVLGVLLDVLWTILEFPVITKYGRQPILEDYVLNGILITIIFYFIIFILNRIRDGLSKK